MTLTDGEVLAWQWLLIMGAFVLGGLMGSRTRRGLPPPDAKSLRSFCDY